MASIDIETDVAKDEVVVTMHFTMEEYAKLTLTCAAEEQAGHMDGLLAASMQLFGGAKVQ